MNPWFGVGFVLAMLISLMTILRWFKHRYNPHPEMVRKLLHIGMGLTTLTFPWLFDQIWPVLVLAGITVPGLFVLRCSERLRGQFGGVIDGVGRDESLGEIYFPLGVTAVFILSGGEPLPYIIPILLLTLADAIAGLIGVRYGRIYYTTAGEIKSVEGSVAFFMVAFLSTCLPLLFFGDISAAKPLFIALLLGLLVMLVEAIAWRGLDNLLIPIIGFFLLNTFINLSVAALVSQLILTIALLAFAILWRNPFFLYHPSRA